ncbi:MAG TPA: hypothetical protein VF826_05165 [Chloroflexia bacterium]
MLDGGVFKCPACGASLKVQGDSPQVECPYCGSTIVVPASLRPPLPATPAHAPHYTTVVVVQPPPQPVYYPPPVHDTTPPRGTKRSDIGAFALWVLALLIFVPFFFVVFVAFTNPRLFDEWTRVSYGRLDTTFGGKGGAPGQFVDAAGIAVDGEGNVYVLEYSGGRVQRFDGAGKLLGSWSVGQYSRCIAADRAGNVYVAVGPGIIKIDSSTGALLDGLSFDTPGDQVESVAVGPDGGVVLALTGSAAAIVRLNGELQETGRYPAPATQPLGSREVLSLAVDGLGQTYVLDRRSNEVYKFSATGSQLARFEVGKQGPTYAIALDAADRVFVSDERYVQVYDSAGGYLGRVTLPNNAGPIHSLAFGPRDELYALSAQSGIVYRFSLTK